VVVYSNEVIQLNPSTESGGKQPFQHNRVYDTRGVMTTLDTDSGRKSILNQQRIRRLTPRECMRLMDFPETFKWDVSDSQAYKQAGNSICVGVLSQIISKLNLKTNSLC
jgi:DNA (cytosine-5)-methyltransferase 1